jgi:two-component system response regulator YesN
MLQLLLVDDEMNVVDTLAVTIDWADMDIHRVHRAYSASEAMNILALYPIDIVITDVRMPGMDGLELSRFIYEHWKHTKCMLLTAHADFEYAQTAIQNNICDYLLKPVSDEYLIKRVSSVVESIRIAKENHDAYNRAMHAMRDHLPRLRSELLYDLLQGSRISADRLEEKINLLEMPVRLDNHIVMMMIRYKDQFSDYNPFEMSLIEFAIGNLAEETVEEYFHVWYCKDVHDYLVLVLIPKEPWKPGQQEQLHAHLNRLTNQIQLNIQHYLKKKVSILLGHWGVFPGDITKLYSNLLLLFGKRFGSEKDLPIYIADKDEMADIRSLERLYEPPLLMHLLEAGSWEAVRDKLIAILEELENDWVESPEHITSVFFNLFATFSYFAHKNGRMLADMIDADYMRGKELAPIKTVGHLKEWVWNVVGKLEQHSKNETKSARMVAVKEAQKYILSNLSSDISVQAISDHIRLHPAYLSKLYKLETGENISDYITRLKMEKSRKLLISSTKKIFEISIEVGYQNPHYFIKVFKKHFGTTPQEYRNAHA